MEEENSRLVETTSDKAVPKKNIAVVMHQLHELIQQLEEAGLTFNEKVMTPDTVEQILITDEWHCEACHESGVQLTTCPVTGKPHRRRLVQVALDLLQLIGSQVGKRYIRQAQLSQRVEGKSAIRTQRRIPLNPQMLLLSFYFVALGEPQQAGMNSIGESDANKLYNDFHTTADTKNDINSTEDAASFSSSPESNSVFSEIGDHFTRDCALHLLDVMHQIKLYGMHVDSSSDNNSNTTINNNNVDEIYANTLLKSFYKAWMQYLRHTHGASAKPINCVDQRLAADELLTGTREALYAAARQLAQYPNDEELKTFVALLLQRVARLASVEQLHNIHAELTRIQQEAPDRLTIKDNNTQSDSNKIEKHNEAHASPVQVKHDETDKAENVQNKATSETEIVPTEISPTHSHNSLEQIPMTTTTTTLSSLSPELLEKEQQVHSSRNAQTDEQPHDISSALTSSASPLPPEMVHSALSSSSPFQHSSELVHTPQITHSNLPVLLSDTNTSGSENDVILPPSEQARVMMGPELPPHWYVNEEGKSRPRPDYAARTKREKFIQLEFKARKAYESIIKVENNTNEVEKATEAVRHAVSEAQLQNLSNEINSSPPDLRGIPRMLEFVQHGLVEAVPRRLRPQLEQELRDVMDWNLVWRSAQKSTMNIARVVHFVLSKVSEYGAPARDDELRQEGEKVCKDLENASPDLGSAVASAFRLLFRAIKQLSEDIAQYSLMMVSGHLQTHAVEFIREFISTCLPPPTEWQSTVQFVQKFINTHEVQTWSLGAISNADQIADYERRVYNAIMYGALDLLRSGNRSSATRWSDFPTEAFYFEKAVIFAAANTVQESTLLLLLEGTVSSILAGKGLSHAKVAETLRELHQDILRLLVTDITLEVLKRSVIDFLDHLLCDEDGNTSKALTEVEGNVVRATIDKMTNTEHALYVAFERKVLNYITKTVRQETNLAPLGLVTASVKQQAELLRKALQFNKIVYAPYYQQLIPSLEIDQS